MEEEQARERETEREKKGWGVKRAKVRGEREGR